LTIFGPSGPPAADSAAKFPAASYPSAASYLAAYAVETARALRTIEAGAFDLAAAMLIDATPGMPGCSPAATEAPASIANHMQVDHVKGIGNSTDLTPSGAEPVHKC